MDVLLVSRPRPSSDRSASTDFGGPQVLTCLLIRARDATGKPTRAYLSRRAGGDGSLALSLTQPRRPFTPSGSWSNPIFRPRFPAISLLSSTACVLHARRAGAPLLAPPPQRASSLEASPLSVVRHRLHRLPLRRILPSQQYPSPLSRFSIRTFTHPRFWSSRSLVDAFRLHLLCQHRLLRAGLLLFRSGAGSQRARS